MSDYFPEHIIVRILERLPIKPLICFSCVSKHWYFVILSDPRFSRAQFQIALQRQTLSRRILVISHDNKCTHEIQSLGIEAGDKRKLQCPFITSPGFVKIVGSCNGLVCVFFQSEEAGNRLYIWNPSTGFFRRLPEPEFPYGLDFYGLGYLSATDNYKFIADISGSKMQAEILSLRTNIWEKIELPYNLHGEGTLLNEKLHWFNKFNASDIFAFDLDEEEFQKMPLPVVNIDKYFKALGASLGGCLCLFGIKNLTDCFTDIWVMKEYGVYDSWTKIFTLKFSPHPKLYITFRPVLIMENSTFLETRSFGYSGGNCKLTKSGHEEEKLEICVLSRTDFEVFEYQETLLYPAKNMVLENVQV